jgi:acyl-CoA dehydrogenase
MLLSMHQARCYTPGPRTPVRDLNGESNVNLNDSDADLVTRSNEIGREVAAKFADEVDQASRFPTEAIAALKHAKVLSAAVPRELGGAGLGIEALMQICFGLGQHCSATGMIVAMHHIQVASIAQHDGGVREVKDYLRRLVREQRLIASATSEVGPSGDLRQSVAAVERCPDGCSLTKKATTISYGAHADDLLISAKRDPNANSNDQVSVLALSGQFQLRDPGVWDTLGMRGTCSPGATIHWQGPAWQVLEVPFGDSARRTMIPYSHLLWGALWVGMATEAVRRTRALIRAKARKTPGQLPATAQHLSHLVATLQSLHSQVFAAGTRYASMCAQQDPALDHVGYAIEMNNLKLTASEAVSDICSEAMRLSGIAAYVNWGEFSCARLLRDSFSAAIMINNYRLREMNAGWLMVHKGD